MAIIHYSDDGLTFDIHYYPTGSVVKQLQQMAADYMNQHPAPITEKEAIEACVDGIIEEGWKLPKLSDCQ